MIDFHSHLLPAVDDGIQTMEEAIQMLKKAQQAGFNKILLTPHYMRDYYEIPKEEIKKKIQQLQQKCQEEQISVELFQANEIYLTSHMIELWQENKIATMNQSRYILFELPMNEEPPDLLEIVYQLKNNNLIPIIAHPERYLYFQENPNKLIQWIEQGVLFQANYGSLIGQYGKHAQKTIKLFLTHNFIHFLGTDVHRNGYLYEQIEKVKKYLRKIMPEEKIEKLTTYNAEKVLHKETIEIELPTKIEKNFLQKFFF